MTRAILRIKKLPRSSTGLAPTLRKFVGMVLSALTFAPDRETSASFKKLREEFRAYFGPAAKIEEALEKRFFSQLYVERVERQEIEDMIPTMRLILVHGLVGTGKTVVLKKIKLNSDRSRVFKIIYFDLKAITEAFLNLRDEKFAERFRRFVFDRISREFIEQSEDVIRDWYVYKIRFDEREEYADLRTWIVQDHVRRPLRTDLQWQKVLEEPAVRERYESLQIKPQLRTLLLFLKSRFPFVLCFDNIDRHHLKVQRQIMSVGLDLSNEIEIPMIVAIREPNLKRIVSEGAFGDTVLLNYLEKVVAGEEKSFRIQDMPKASIATLLQHRLKLVEDNGAFGALTEFFQDMEKKHQEDFAEFEKQFWGIFGQISTTFIDEGIYRYCNYSIRDILILYFKFITKLLLNPEERYNLSQLLPSNLEIRVTRLRNYFYKWLICPDAMTPTPDKGLLNIFRHCGPKLRMLDLRILEYLFNWETRHPGGNLKFGDMARVFKRFGVKREILRKRVLDLTKNQKVTERGFVWLDKKKGAAIPDSTIMQLMPAGSFFLQRLSSSREYTFWHALTADLPQDVVGRSFGLSETYKDRFKHIVVYTFTTEILLPAMEAEREYFDQKLRTPGDWVGSNLDFFDSCFSVSGNSYAERLVFSVIKTIKHADLLPPHKREFDTLYGNLLTRARRLSGSVETNPNP